MNKIDAIASIPIMSVKAVDEAAQIARELIVCNNNLSRMVEGFEQLDLPERLPLKELIEFLYDRGIFYDQNNVWQKD